MDSHKLVVPLVLYLSFLHITVQVLVHNHDRRLAGPACFSLCKAFGAFNPATQICYH